MITRMQMDNLIKVFGEMGIDCEETIDGTIALTGTSVVITDGRNPSTGITLSDWRSLPYRTRIAIAHMDVDQYNGD